MQQPVRQTRVPLARAVALGLTLAASAAPASAASFQYRGTLYRAGAPVEGIASLRLTVYDAPNGGHVLMPSITAPDRHLQAGAFELELELDDRLSANPGLWLEVEVAAADGSYHALAARESIFPKTALAGVCWDTTGTSGTIGDTNYLGTADNQPLELRVNALRAARYEPNAISPNLIGGFSGNFAGATVRGAAIAGGGAAAEPIAAVSGPNRVTDHYGTVGGGLRNQAGDGSGTAEDRAFATVGGGVFNEARGAKSTVGGGSENFAVDEGAVVAGGDTNTASSSFATVGGGASNTASGFESTVGGGAFNCAGGEWSWAGGRNATVRPGADSGDTGPLGSGCSGVSPSAAAEGDAGTFVWADSTAARFGSSGPDQFLVRARGGFGLNAPPPNNTIEMSITAEPSSDFAQLLLRQRASGNPGILFSAGNATAGNDAELYIDHYNGSAQSRRAAFLRDGSVYIRSNITGAATGVNLASGAGAWSNLSDRSVKTAVLAVDAGAVLEQLAALPLSTWQYRAQDPGIRHLGPMAQDFSAAFGLGEDDTHISTVDADGVALAAIQGLNLKLETERHEHDARIDALERARGDAEQRAADLREQVDRLRERLDALSGGAR